MLTFKILVLNGMSPISKLNRLRPSFANVRVHTPDITANDIETKAITMRSDYTYPLGNNASSVRVFVFLHNDSSLDRIRSEKNSREGSITLRQLAAYVRVPMVYTCISNSGCIRRKNAVTPGRMRVKYLPPRALPNSCTSAPCLRHTSATGDVVVCNTCDGHWVPHVSDFVDFVYNGLHYFLQTIYF